MKQEKIKSEAKEIKTPYLSPSLILFGNVAQISASGSEGPDEQNAPLVEEPSFTIKNYRP